VVPADPPPGWSESGFIFAQIQTGGTIIYCIDAETGEEQSLKNCDYGRGDQFIREGNRNERDAATIHAILASLSLDEI